MVIPSWDKLIWAPSGFFSRITFIPNLNMDNINGGYISLVFVLVLFLLLQAWWISMTIRNNSDERALAIDNQTDLLREKLEKVFRMKP